MFCNKCGQEVKENCRFCPNCGNEIQKVTERKKKEHKNLKKGIFGIVTILAVIALIVIGKNIWSLRSVENSNETKESKTVEDVEENVSEEDTEQYFACVQDENMKYGFIDESGNEMIQCQYDIGGDFSWFGNTLAPVGKKIGENEDGIGLYEWGFIDKTGEMVIPYQFDMWNGDSYIYSANISPNVAPVVKQVNINGDTVYRWGFIDKAGALVIPYEYSAFQKGSLSDSLDKNLIAVRKEVDVAGETESKWGFINEKNETVIEFLYDDAGSFSADGLAVVEKDGLYGYINADGEEVIPFKFQEAGTFGKNGKAVVIDENDKWGVIDKTGEIVNYLENQEYSFISHYDYFMENGLSPVADYDYDNSAGLIDENGREIVSCGEYSFIGESDANGDMIVCKKVDDTYNYLYGLMNSKGEMVIPLQYDSMSRMGDNGWSPVGTRRSDSDEEYDCKYIDKDNRVMLELSDKYIGAGRFIKVN